MSKFESTLFSIINVFVIVISIFLFAILTILSHKRKEFDLNPELILPTNSEVIKMMGVLGIQFAPLNVPLHRRLETLAAAATVALIVLGGPFATYLLVHVIFYSQYWPIGVLYLIWAYIIDRNTSERGGRRIEWVRGWSIWRHLVNYFPANIEPPSSKLDPNKNYIFSCYPHGILPLGLFASFSSQYGSAKEVFPHHKPYAMTLRENFFMPLVRDLFLALGGCSVSKESIEWLLSSAKGGKILCLATGGTAEALESRPGQYRILLRNRKGFVKLAIRNGTPLVPVITFGEPDLFDQLDNPKGSNVRRVQEWIKSVTGFAPTVFLGRGFFQYSFGIIPFRKPLTTVVGEPFEIVKAEHPTQEQIDTVHKEFMNRLTELFEAKKYKYLQNPEKVSLIIN